MTSEPLLQPGPVPDETGRAARLPLIAYARDRETSRHPD